MTDTTEVMRLFDYTFNGISSAEGLLCTHSHDLAAALRTAVEQLVAERDAMKAALQGLVDQFPTDMDLDHIGWLASDVNAACAAYDAARALVEGKP